MMKIQAMAIAIVETTSTKFICRFSEYDSVFDGGEPLCEEQSFKTRKKAFQFMWRVINETAAGKRNDEFSEIVNHPFFSVEIIAPNGVLESFAFRNEIDVDEEEIPF